RDEGTSETRPHAALPTASSAGSPNRSEKRDPGYFLAESGRAENRTKGRPARPSESRPGPGNDQPSTVSQSYGGVGRSGRPNGLRDRDERSNAPRPVRQPSGWYYRGSLPVLCHGDHASGIR